MGHSKPVPYDAISFPSTSLLWLHFVAKRKIKRSKEWIITDKPWGLLCTNKKVFERHIGPVHQLPFQGCSEIGHSMPVPYDKASVVRPRIQKKDQQEQRMIIRQTLGILCIGKKVFERLIGPVHQLPFQGWNRHSRFQTLRTPTSSPIGRDGGEGTNGRAPFLQPRRTWKGVAKREGKLDV